MNYIILEFASAVNLPVTGEQGKLYLTKDDNKIYRWNVVFIVKSAVVILSSIYYRCVDFTPEKRSDNVDSYSVSSTATYPSTRLVDGLGTKRRR